jgi:hypothetical protein
MLELKAEWRAVELDAGPGPGEVYQTKRQEPDLRRAAND